MHFPHRMYKLGFHGYKTFEQFYFTGKIGNQNVSAFVEHQISLYEHNYTEVMTAWEETHQQGVHFDEALAQLAPNLEEERLEHQQQSSEIDCQIEEEHEDNVPDISSMNRPPNNNLNVQKSRQIAFSTETIRPILRSLNQRQTKLFYFVRKWCLQKVQGKNPEPFTYS